MKKQEYIDLGISQGLVVSQVEAIMCKILKTSREEFFKMTDISSKYIYHVQQIFFDVKSGIPEEYVLEKANFYGRDFYVDARVLIPRNDTEILVTKMLEEINQNIDVSNSIYIDVGTGSGCIAITIAEEIYPLKFYKSYGLDMSSQALDVAKINAEKLTQVGIIFQQSNLLEIIGQEDTMAGKSLCITANLPYIKNRDIAHMHPRVIKYEPQGALYGGVETGFELYKKLIKQCFSLKKVLQPEDIVLMIEIGFDQAQYSRDFLSELGLTFEYFSDSANIYRVILIRGF